jgi:molecular chaperone DnaK
MEKLRTAVGGDSLEEINKAKEELQAVSHKLAEQMYKQASEAAGAEGMAEGAAGAGGPGDQAADMGSEPDEKKEGAVDADFEVVDDDKK